MPRRVPDTRAPRRARRAEPRPAAAAAPRTSAFRGVWPVVLATAAALAWRAWVFVRLHRTPVGDLLDLDSRVYWEWAGKLAGGDWIGSHPFFMAPLYPYVLGLVRALTGATPTAVQALQCVASALAVGALTWLLVRLHGPRWGFAFGLLLAGYAPWTFLDVQLVMEPLLLALQVGLLVVLLARREREASFGEAALAALLVGAMAQARATNLLVAIPAGAWLLSRTTRGRRLRQAMVLVAVLAATAVPTTLRSLRVGGEAIPFTYGLGYNFYVGNHEGANGAFVNLPGTADVPEGADLEGGTIGDGRDLLANRSGAEPSPAASSRQWLGRAVAGIARDPGAWLRLLVRKARLALNAEEASQIQSHRAYDVIAGPMGWPIAGGFGLLGILGLVGLALAVRGSPAERLLAGLWLAFALPMLVFFVTDRYRVHLVPTMALLAPLGLRRLGRAFVERRALAVTALLAGFGAAGALVLPSLSSHTRDSVRYEVATTMATAYLQAGRAPEAMRELDAAIALDRRGGMPGQEGPSARAQRAAVFASHAVLSMRAGEWTTAVADFETARRLVPGDASNAADFAIALAASGAGEAAREMAARAGLADSVMRDELLVRVRVSEAANRLPAMAGELRALLAFAPHWEPAVVALVRLEIRQGELEDARRRLERERAAGLREPIYRVHLAVVLDREGRRREAGEVLRSIPPEVRERDPVVAATLQAFPLAPAGAAVRPGGRVP